MDHKLINLSRKYDEPMFQYQCYTKSPIPYVRHVPALHDSMEVKKLQS